MKKYICLGFNVDKGKGYVTGLAMMHDLFMSILREHGYSVHSISLNSDLTLDSKVGKPSVSRYFEYFRIIRAVIVSFAKNNNAVFYFNPSTTRSGFYRDVLLIVLAKMFNHKVLMQQFGALFESFKKGLNRVEQRLLVWSYNKVEMIIVEGEYAKRQYSFIKKQEIIKTIQNGLPELNTFEEKNFKTYVAGEAFNLFFMNNMIESKGYFDVLKAIDILVNSRNRNVTCVFAGKFMSLEQDEYFDNSEDAKDFFDKFIAERNLVGRVTYYDCVFDKKKDEIFRKSHVFLLPSYYVFEGQPTAILEALSYGCVPIVTRYRLIPDMVDESCGLFVEKKSPVKIADAVESLMNNPTSYNLLSVNGFNRFNERFTQEAYANKLLHVIKQL